MKFLLTNDDGIHAPGLQTLEAAAREFGETITIAPLEHLSGCSHQVTTERPLAVSQHGNGRFAVDGNPADCVRLGLSQLATDVDWVLSGVNDGGNLGVDVNMSGTVAAVREGTYLGKPGIALSRYRRNRQVDNWNEVREMTVRVLRELLARELPPRVFWNVNLPDLTDSTSSLQGDTPIVDCPLDLHPLPSNYELVDGAYHYRTAYSQRPRAVGSDVDVCFGNRIAVTGVALPGNSEPIIYTV